MPDPFQPPQQPGSLAPKTPPVKAGDGLLPYLVAFQQTGLGVATLRSLLALFDGRLETLTQARSEELRASGISPALVSKLLEIPTLGRRVTEILARCANQNIAVVGCTDPEYPELLLETHSPPVVLYVRGNQPVLARPRLTVVGTRSPSPYGLSAVATLVAPIARAGVSIVSGLAYGIDAAAHRSALQVGGQTIAVLGSGPDVIYPRRHAELADELLAHGGAILSEYPPGTEPQRFFFPQRNRILAGLAPATLIVEAGLTSGALITARFALDENRELFAVPGPISAETSAGPNNLLRLGARLAAEPRDLLDVFGLVEPQMKTPIVADSPNEAALLGLLNQVRHVDELVAMSNCTTSVVNATLSLLEMKGRIRHLGGLHYIRQ